MKNPKVINSLLCAVVTTSPVIVVTVVFVVLLLQNLSGILESVICVFTSVLALCWCYSLVKLAYNYFQNNNWE